MSNYKSLEKLHDMRCSNIDWISKRLFPIILLKCQCQYLVSLDYVSYATFCLNYMICTT